MTTTDELILSPCIRNCCLNEEDICLGCFRCLTEVIGWADADNAARQVVLDNTKCRRAAYHQKYKQFP
jgi:uncharacterized protein